MRSLALLLAAILATVLAQAQKVSITVKGTVTDQSGGLVPNAECTLTNMATQPKTTVSMAADGSFVFLDVLAGRYELS
jgi:hypothetical protein